ncbi:S41 family peptidase [Stratiformator vulcanicus]|uniref:Putative CtpA-like serine protease n=1 Tax=Stratiformator vulcanicus TaxID=2527980 RepID=A0A517R2F0_9PLAN|nr:S41 family peptidase [Stratiformator vulcanicus]QDT38038.1 putative CtpA-like serine protease [Stratiformator vulcanicus]
MDRFATFGLFPIARLALAFAIVISALGVTPVRADDEQASDEEMFELFREFVESVEQIDRNYVNQVDRRVLFQAAIRGMVKELDPYSNYIPPKKLDQFTQEIEQEFGGIGIQVQVDPRSRRLVVTSPLPGTPAYRGGVRAGDIIMEIEGESTEDFTLEDAVARLKGKPGEAVTIGVLHKGEDEIETIEVVRDIIQVSTVLGDRYGEGDHWEYFIDDDEEIAYVRLTHFSRRSGAELRGVLRELLDDGMKGLILDLRFNPGGLLDQARQICDMFIDSGVIVSTKGRNTPERTWEARKGGTLPEFPVAVLVNRFSASASEIVSACLQDHERAAVIGERTWGKGSVQNVIDLGGGSSALKLTTASYHRPSGKNIHRFPDSTEDDVWGVTPDEEYRIRFDDGQLRSYLIERRRRDVIGGDDTEESSFKDPHIEAGLKYLRGAMNAEAPAEAEKKAASIGPAGRLNPLGPVMLAPTIPSSAA